MITTKRGTDEWHGDAAFYERAAALNARFPIENPAPNPKQPFSRQNYVGTLGGPSPKDKLWFFSSLRSRARRRQHRLQPRQPDAVQRARDAGRARADSRRKLDLRAQLAFPSPSTIIWATTRLDWSQSPRSQWFLRCADG